MTVFLAKKFPRQNCEKMFQVIFVQIPNDYKIEKSLGYSNEELFFNEPLK